MGLMTPDEVWGMGFFSAFSVALLELMVPVVACYFAMTVVFFLKREVAVGTLCAVFIVLCLTIPFGILISLAFGWRNASRWKMKAFMSLWTGLVVMLLLHFAANWVLSDLDPNTLRSLFERSR